MPLTRIPPTRPEHTTRDPEVLRADITEKEIATNGPDDGHRIHEKWIVDGVQAVGVYGKPHLATVWSPCCNGKRQRLQHGYAFSCPTCGWWWRYHQLGWTTRVVSIGMEKPA